MRPLSYRTRLFSYNLLIKNMSRESRALLISASGRARLMAKCCRSGFLFFEITLRPSQNDARKYEALLRAFNYLSARLFCVYFLLLAFYLVYSSSVCARTSR